MARIMAGTARPMARVALALVCIAGMASANDELGDKWGPNANITSPWYKRCCKSVAADTSTCSNETFVDLVKPRLCEENGEGTLLPFSTGNIPPVPTVPLPPPPRP